MVRDDCMKYEEAEIAIFKTINCGGGGGLCGIQYATRLGEGCLINPINTKSDFPEPHISARC